MDSNNKVNGEKTVMSRTSRNEELYRKINSEELDNYSIRSNATVIGNQSNDIDVEKIKEILDKRYNDAPKRKSIRIEKEEVDNPIIHEDTKEYDINTVIEKAKDEKKETYDDARGQKLHNTQYNILNKLNIKEEEKDDDTDESLMELINTITINEKKLREAENKSDDDLEDDDSDLFDDLKGDDSTQTYEGMAEEVTKENKEEDIEVETEKEKVKEEKINPEELKSKKLKKENDLDDSFYTEKLFKKKDFVETDDEFLDDDKLSVGIKILIVLVIISFLVGLFLFLKSFIGF